MTDKKGVQEIIGKVWITNIKETEDWLSSEDRNNFYIRNWSDKCQDWNKGEKIGFYNLQGKIVGLSHAIDYMKAGYNTVSLIEKAQYYERHGQAFGLLYATEQFVMFCDAKDSYILPARFCTVEKQKDYSNVSISQLHAISGGSNRTSMLPSTTDDVSMADLQSEVNSKKTLIEKKEAELKALEKEKDAELEAYKKMLEEKFRKRNELLQQKMDELNAVKETLEKQMLMLETEIYAIRCYHGETIDFTRIASGKEVSPDVPLIIYQKLRYIDEEMGKLLSVYGFDGNTCDMKYFEDVLKERQDIRDLFAPSDKCMSILKVSRTGRGYSSSEGIANMLVEYEKYHGSTLAVLIRNGENLYIGWTDENRIRIVDDNVFFIPKEQEIVDDELRSSSRDDMISRYFVFSMLQGLCDAGTLFKLPERVNVTRPNPYIVFSAADGWIEDNTYGSFDDIVARTSVDLKKGDIVLTTQRITRDDIYEHDGNGQFMKYRAYNNDRGRGIKNRTHDVSIRNCALYQINLVDITRNYTVYYKEYPYSVTKIKTPDTRYKNAYFINYEYNELQGPPPIKTMNIDFKNNERHGQKLKDLGTTMSECLAEYCMLYQNGFGTPINETDYARSGTDAIRGVLKVFDHFEENTPDYEYFISEEKVDGWKDTHARANMQVYKDEILDLTFLNSVYLRYAITNKKLGTWRIGGSTVDFAFAIKYLNTALAYLDKREVQEKEMLEKYMKLYDGWQVDVSEWRLEKGYHTLTPARAKAFAKRAAV